MAIGEFGGAPAAAGDTGPMYAAPAYWLYEMIQAGLNPSRALAEASRLFFRNPANPMSYTPFGKHMAASMELFERTTPVVDPAPVRDRVGVGGGPPAPGPGGRSGEQHVIGADPKDSSGPDPDPSSTP